jgi:hypothetical protein
MFRKATYNYNLTFAAFVGHSIINKTIDDKVVICMKNDTNTYKFI